MPEALKNGVLTQEEIDTLDVIWNGTRSDAYLNLESVEITRNDYGITLSKAKRDMTIGDLMSWLRSMSPSMFLTLGTEEYDELRQIFPKFEKNASLIGVSHSDFTQQKRDAVAKKNKRKRFFGKIIAAGIATTIVGGLALTITAFFSAIGLIYASVGLLIFAIGIMGVLAYREIESIWPDMIYAHVERSDKAASSQTWLKLCNLIEKHPEYIDRKLVDFKNLDEFLNGEKSMHALKVKAQIEEAAKQIELTLENQKKTSALQEPVRKLREIFKTRT